MLSASAGAYYGGCAWGTFGCAGFLDAWSANPRTVAPDISPETLLIQTSETLASLNAMTTDLAFELEGVHRHKLLATQQLIVLGELLVERVLALTQDTQTFQ